MLGSEPFRAEKKKDNDYSIKNLYKIRGIIEIDFFAINVRHSGLFIYDEDEGVCNKVICPEGKSSEIDQIKATPNGKFLAVGFP